MVTASELVFGYGAVIDDAKLQHMQNLMRQRNPGPYDEIEGYADAEPWERDLFKHDQLTTDVHALFNRFRGIRPLLIIKDPALLVFKTCFRRQMEDGGPSATSRSLKVTSGLMEEAEQDEEVHTAIALATTHLGLQKEDFGWYLFEYC